MENSLGLILSIEIFSIYVSLGWIFFKLFKLFKFGLNNNRLAHPPHYQPFV